MGKKVLMTTMQMGIGGAETHILELSKGLVREGYEVIVASNGGAYVENLITNGVKHVTLPLHNKQPINVYKSYKGIEKIIREEKVDIVHGHARIPAFICGLLHKKYDFKFVTTAHGVFKTGFFLNKITNWGEKTLAISQDIKEYLMCHYEVPEQDIIMTINGINTRHYNAGEHKGKVGQKAHVIHVSRLEKDTSDVANMLIKGLEKDELREKVERMTIIGDGEMLASLKDYGRQVNGALGENKIHFTGSITNVEEYLREADVFVGISRAALEAMSAKCPVILAGNPGFQGLIDKKLTEEYRKNNFTCRDTSALDYGQLIDELDKVLELEPALLEQIGQDERAIVEKYYSVDKMVGDAVSCYNA